MANIHVCAELHSSRLHYHKAGCTAQLCEKVEKNLDVKYLKKTRIKVGKQKEK